MTTTAKAAPEGPLTHRQIITILVGLMMGMFLAALDQTIVATSIRTIADDLHGLDNQAWATTAYLITATLSTPLYGKLSDIYGRKLFFSAAISIFVTGSVLCTFSQSMGELAVFRAIQGLGAGGLMSLALAILGDIVSPRERARYQGYFLAVFGTSSVLGPVIGGFFAGADSILGVTGWRWVFLVNVPFGIAALTVVAKTLHLRHTRLEHRIDWWGAVALAVGIVPLLIVAEQGRDWGWDSTRAIICYAVGVVGLVAFLLAERAMGEEALLPLKLFRNRTIAVASGGGVLLGMAMFGGLVSLPLYLQIVKGATPTESGLMLLPLTLGIMTGSIISGQTISRIGRYRRFPRAGVILLALALFAFSFIHADTPLWQTMLIMVFFGIGLGFNMQPLTLAVQNAAPAREIGVATSTATFTRQIGGTIGTAVFLSILFSTVPGKITDAIARIAPTRSFQQALQDPANAAFAKQFEAAQTNPGTSTGQATGVLSDSSFLKNLDPRLARPFLEGFSNAMDVVFLTGASVMLVAVVVLWMLPHVELRTGSAYSERDQEDTARRQALEAAQQADGRHAGGHEVDGHHPNGHPVDGHELDGQHVDGDGNGYVPRHARQDQPVSSTTS